MSSGSRASSASVISIAPGPGMPRGRHDHLLVREELAELEPAPRQARPTTATSTRPSATQSVTPRLSPMSRVIEMSGNFSLNRPRMAGRMYSPGMVLPPTTRTPLIRPWNAVHRLPRLAREGEHAPRVREQQLAGPRDAGAAPQPVEQAHAELVLEGADMLGHGGLGEMQRLGGAGKGGELGHLGEDLELAQIHGGRV